MKFFSEKTVLCKSVKNRLIYSLYFIDESNFLWMKENFI